MINADDVRIVETRKEPSNTMYRQRMSLESIIDLYAEMPRDKLLKTLRSSYETEVVQNLARASRSRWI